MPPKQSNQKKQKKQKTIKPVCREVDTSCAKKTRAYSKPADLDVEKDINKNKEVKESDVFDVPKAKQTKKKSPKKKMTKSNY